MLGIGVGLCGLLGTVLVLVVALCVGDQLGGRDALMAEVAGVLNLPSFGEQSEWRRWDVEDDGAVVGGGHALFPPRLGRPFALGLSPSVPVVGFWRRR